MECKHPLPPLTYYEHLPIGCFRCGCLHAKGIAQASSRPKSWYQDNDSHDSSLIILAVNHHLSRIYFLPDIMLSTLHPVFHINFRTILKQGAIINFILQRRRWRSTEQKLSPLSQLSSRKPESDPRQFGFISHRPQQSRHCFPTSHRQ